MNAGGSHHFVFFLCRARPAADDGAGVTHAAARRRRLSCDEPNHGLANAGADKFRGLLLSISANLTDHDDAVGIGIVIEKANGIEE